MNQTLKRSDKRWLWLSELWYLCRFLLIDWLHTTVQCTYYLQLLSLPNYVLLLGVPNSSPVQCTYVLPTSVCLPTYYLLLFCVLITSNVQSTYLIPRYCSVYLLSMLYSVHITYCCWVYPYLHLLSVPTYYLKYCSLYLLTNAVQCPYYLLVLSVPITSNIQSTYLLPRYCLL